MKAFFGVVSFDAAGHCRISTIAVVKHGCSGNLGFSMHECAMSTKRGPSDFMFDVINQCPLVVIFISSSW